jgi:hypothetical protein
MSRHNFDYVSTDPQDVKTVVSRTEATQVLVLNSKNRNFSSQTGNSPVTQPWNSFRLGRPQALMQSYATRVAVTEIRFPWYIPNITSRNNSIWITGQNEQAQDIIVQITLPPGWYSPADIVVSVNQQIVASDLENKTIFAYDEVNQVYSFEAAVNPPDPTLRYWFFDPTSPTGRPTESQFNSSPSLAKTLGFEYYQVNGITTIPNSLTDISGNPTESLYTQYIDIVSEKLNYYSDQKDGSSDPLTSQALVCRLYLADEISMGQNEGTFFQPFLIHRQFKTPKTVMWNKDAVVDWLDISVYDEYGQLVPLPTNSIGGTNVAVQTKVGAYPDFQITLTATEN